jgi:hypothetical protein
MPFIKNKFFMPNQPNTSDTFFSNRLNLTLATLFVLGMTSLLAASRVGFNPFFSLC